MVRTTDHKAPRCVVLLTPVLGHNIFFSTLFSNTLSLSSSLNVRAQVSHPHKTTGKIIVLYILICIFLVSKLTDEIFSTEWEQASIDFNPYPTAFPYGNGMVLHFYQQQESSTTKTVHKVINKGLKTYV